ncbi:MAG: peptidyl-prolyl cis-trans isomerase [Myxococcaceae bacterium]|jgi:peptidyl-prolyl cis-trans isomerase C|nr:peptidyl-prolyl cis-trans isomerase [Myxococcaceae bacterium]MCA3016557.1 peptidyl-prolyl cis-trans isomerase [Myxococcaceae bacterium]
MSMRLCLVLLVSSACTQQQKQAVDENVVATVNGDVVSRADFERELSRESQAMEGSAPRTPEQIEPFKQALLETMVERLVLLQAAKEAQVQVSADEVDRRVLALTSEYPAGTFDTALAQSQTSRTELARRTHDQLVIEKLLAEQVFARVAVTEEQLRRAYDENPDAWVEPEQVHAQQLVVKGLDEAKRLQQLLWQGKKFSDLARKYSLSPDGKVGGDLGFFKRGEMPPAFDDAIFRLPVGGTSEVVSTDYGFHLFRLVERKPARKRELTEVRGALEQKLLAALRAERQVAYVTALREKAQVKVNAPVLLSITGRPSSGGTEP